MRWLFKYGKGNEVLLHESLIKSIKESQYYSKNFINKKSTLEGIKYKVVNKKRHRNTQQGGDGEAILLTEHPNDKAQFIFFRVSYNNPQVSGKYFASGAYSWRVINLSEKIPSIHKPEYSKDKCNAGNMDNAGWDEVEIFLPGFKQKMQLSMEEIADKSNSFSA